MCQSIQTTYKFCGCRGEFYQQKCPAPTAACHRLLKNTTTLPLSCYCERHSSTTFKTVRQDQREAQRFNKEYNKVLAREKEQKQQRQEAMNIRTAGHVNHREQQQALMQQRRGNVTDLRRKEREMEEYGRKFGEQAKRMKYPVATARAEEYGRKKAQEDAMLRQAGRKKPGVRETSGGICVVM